MRLIFDLDGTLVDSLPSMLVAANRMLVDLGRPPVSPEVCARFVGHGVRVLVKRLLEFTGGLPEDGVERALGIYGAFYAADPVTGTVAYPGVSAALDRLAGAGHGLGVCTQKPNGPGLAILRALSLMPPITAFTGGESVGALKPDPRMFAHAAGQLPPGPGVMIGDSLTDARTAQAAGVPFLLHTRGYRHDPISEIPHDAAFDEFAHLPALVDALAGGR